MKCIICNGKSFLLFLLFCLCSEKKENPPTVLAGTVTPEILSTLVHDSTAFTQGLLFRDSVLFESTGLVGQSTIRIVDTTGMVKTRRHLPGIFAEGCSFLKDLLYQITWTEQTCIVYDSSLNVLRTLPYDGEGWGLTTDSKTLIMSNGSDTLYFRDENFKIIRKLPVSFNGKPLKNLNELEYAEGKILANVWFSDFIYEISPQTGAVLRTVDCTELVNLEKPEHENNVLNGIAFVPQGNRFFLTGKNWKNMFLVKIPGY